MCGIVGLIDRDGVTPARLTAMTDAIVHRGPDDEGVFAGGEAGLAMRRLSIIDLGGGHQPMTNERGTLQVVQNGEIYNYQDLFAELQAKGHHFRTRSDTEAIVHAYEEWGDDCLAHLWGMFALAIWDGERRRMLVARDRLGKKPLFWTERDGRFAFASELKALRCLPWLPDEPDPASLQTYLATGFIPAPNTVFRGVQKLRAGEAGVWEHGRFRRWQYWDAPPDPSPPRSRGEAVERARTLVEDAVRRRLLADVPVGALLSSGIDSSTVVGVAARLKPDLDTFTVGFDERELDEADEAASVARRLGTRHHPLVVNAQVRDVLPDVAWHLDEPLADPAAIPTFLISKVARRHVTVVFSGEGADEVFAGYRYYRWEVAAHAYRRVLPWVGGRRLHDRLAAAAARRGWRRASHFFDGAGAANPVGLPHWTRIVDDGLPPLLAPALQPRVAGRNPREPYAEYYARRSGDPLLNRLLYVDQRTFMADDLLMKVDRMTMAHSMEARTPYLDHRLVELLAATPPAWKFGFRGATKPLLREVARAWLPDDVLARRKRVFATPLDRWLTRDLAEPVGDLLLGGGAGSGWLDRDAVRAAHARFASGRPEYARLVWASLLLELWHAEWRRRPSAAPAGVAS